MKKEVDSSWTAEEELQRSKQERKLKRPSSQMNTKKKLEKEGMSSVLGKRSQQQPLKTPRKKEKTSTGADGLGSPAKKSTISRPLEVKPNTSMT